MIVRSALVSILASLLAFAAGAETVFTNVNGYTLDETGRLQRFSAFVVSDEGRVSQILPANATPPEGETVDLGGRTVLPGLIDAHGHVMGLGQKAQALDLTGTKTLTEALAAVRDYAAANPEAPWILGRGWNQVSWGMDSFPTAADLDTVVTDRPVLLERVDGHASWVNSAALRLAGLSAASADPEGGQIIRLEDGSPAGVLVDRASDAVYAAVPASSPEQLEAALIAALRKMASVGLTGVHDAGIDASTWQLYRRFAEEGRLTARIAAMAGGMEALNRIAPEGPTGWLYADRLSLNTVKLYADGALGSRGAAMIEPYSDDPDNSGLLMLSGAKLRNQIASAAARGFQVNVHAIGDLANREVLQAFADVGRYIPSRGRHRIEHAQIVAVEDLPRFAELGVIASVQPTHATSDKAMAEDRVGPERIKGGYAWKTLADSGARLAGGSDFPVEPANPFFGLHAAVTREDRAGEPAGGWYPQEALSLTQALAAFTTGAAHAGGMERFAGSLTPGKWADFIVLGRDPFEVEPDALWQIQVEETWLAGAKIFDLAE